MIRELSELTDEIIQQLIACLKVIVDKDPRKDYKEDKKYLRAEIELISKDENNRFRMFIRKHIEFPENFSIGLDYKSQIGDIKLIRFNGPHKTVDDDIDNHHFNYHIHKHDPEFLDKGIIQLSNPDNTSEYHNFEEALKFAFQECHVENHQDWFPGIDQLELFKSEV